MINSVQYEILLALQNGSDLTSYLSKSGYAFLIRRGLIRLDEDTKKRVVTQKGKMELELFENNREQLRIANEANKIAEEANQLSKEQNRKSAHSNLIGWIAIGLSALSIIADIILAIFIST